MVLSSKLFHPRVQIDYTLVELMVVLSIVATLAAISVRLS
jgi:prepilin-type N-terminal cleavage/methylation domain-containing protein